MGKGGDACSAHINWRAPDLSSRVILGPVIVTCDPSRLKPVGLWVSGLVLCCSVVPEVKLE